MVLTIGVRRVGDTGALIECSMYTFGSRNRAITAYMISPEKVDMKTALISDDPDVLQTQITHNKNDQPLGLLSDLIACIAHEVPKQR